MLLTLFIVSSILVSVTTILSWLQQQVLSNLARSRPPTACNTDGDAVQFVVRMLSRFVVVYKHFLLFFRMQSSPIQLGAKKLQLRNLFLHPRFPVGDCLNPGGVVPFGWWWCYCELEWSSTLTRGATVPLGCPSPPYSSLK